MENEKQKENLKELKHDISKFILEEINLKYKNNEEKVLCELLNAMGYETRVARKSAGEKDIIATKPGTELTILLQINQSAFNNEAESQEKAVFNMDNNYDVLVTLSNYGDSENNYAKELKVNKALGGKEIVEMIFKYYEKMSEDFKKNIQLKSMLIPREWDIQENNNILLN